MKFLDDMRSELKRQARRIDPEAVALRDQRRLRILMNTYGGQPLTAEQSAALSSLLDEVDAWSELKFAFQKTERTFHETCQRRYADSYRKANEKGDHVGRLLVEPTAADCKELDAAALRLWEHEQKLVKLATAFGGSRTLQHVVPLMAKKPLTFEEEKRRRIFVEAQSEAQQQAHAMRAYAGV